MACLLLAIDAVLASALELNGLTDSSLGRPMLGFRHDSWLCVVATLIGMAVFFGGGPQPVLAIEAGDTCVLTGSLTVSAKRRGKGKKIKFDEGERLAVQKAGRGWLRVSTTSANGFVTHDRLERVCEPINDPWREAPPPVPPPSDNDDVWAGSGSGSSDPDSDGLDAPPDDEEMAARAAAARAAAERELDAQYAEADAAMLPSAATRRENRVEELNWEVDTGATVGNGSEDEQAGGEGIDGEPIEEASVARSPLDESERGETKLPPVDTSAEPESFFVGVLAGGGVGSEPESTWFVFDVAVDCGWRVGEYVSLGARLFVQGTPGIGYGLGGGMGTLRLIMPSSGFEPYLDAGVGYAIGGAGHLTSTVVGRVSLGGRLFFLDTFYVSLEAASVFSEFSVSGVGLVGAGWSL